MDTQETALPFGHAVIGHLMLPALVIEGTQAISVGWTSCGHKTLDQKPALASDIYTAFNNEKERYNSKPKRGTDTVPI